MAVLIRFLYLPLALSLFALGPSPALAVFGGSTIGNGDAIARSVAAIIYRDAAGAHLCTAAVLAPKLLLTAAHCTEGERDQIKVIFGTSLMFIDSSQIRAVADIARAGKTAASKGMSVYEDPDDVALVLLSSPAPSGTQFASLADAAPSTTIGVAGYGATSELRRPDASGHHQLGFDQTLRATAVPLLSRTGALLVADQTRGTGVCTGDSGAPGFQPGGKTLAIVGVLIGVASPRDSNDYCRGKAYFASIARWKSWIVATAGKLGQKL